MSMHETLAGLGGTAGEVADSLRRLGVRGVPRRCHDCPLARLLAATFDSGRVSVSWACAAHTSPGEGPMRFCNLPGGCAEFVLAFDNLQFPDLVEGQE
jgi:hypothetical protein